jgi:hypothetical protein
VIETTPAMHPTLAAALVDAQSKAQAVEKASTNTFQKYKYASADAMIAEGREALSLSGLTLMSAGWHFSEGKIETSDGAAVGRVTISYRLIHKSGHAFDFTSSSFVVPGKGRPADKAEMGAVTENLGYTIRGLLLLPRVDEGASVERRDDRSDTQGASQRQAPARAANDGASDPAHVALAADFERRVVELPDLSAFGDFVRDVEAAGLPKPLLDIVRAAVVVQGVRFAVEKEDLEAWVPKLQAWKLEGDARERAAEAWIRRGDEIAAQGGAAA